MGDSNTEPVDRQVGKALYTLDSKLSDPGPPFFQISLDAFEPADGISVPGSHVIQGTYGVKPFKPGYIF